jgi:hypothetical protein
LSDTSVSGIPYSANIDFNWLITAFDVVPFNFVKLDIYCNNLLPAGIVLLCTQEGMFQPFARENLEHYECVAVLLIAVSSIANRWNKYIILKSSHKHLLN